MKKYDILTGALLCFTGGAVNGYSYTMRGGVLAAAQTANLLVAALEFSTKDVNGAFLRLIPIVCFLIGVFTTHLLCENLFHDNIKKWAKYLLTIQAVAFWLLGFTDGDTPDIAANSVMSFLTAMQCSTFRSFGENAPFATVFSTGNMRSMSDNFYMWIFKKDTKAKKRTLSYGIMLVSFALGGIGSYMLSCHIAYKACWLVSISLLAAWLSEQA